MSVCYFWMTPIQSVGKFTLLVKKCDPESILTISSNICVKKTMKMIWNFTIYKVWRIIPFDLPPSTPLTFCYKCCTSVLRLLEDTFPECFVA